MNFSRSDPPLWVLTGGAGADGFGALRQALVTAMAGAGLRKQIKTSFTPHMTLSYSGPDGDEQTVDPIGWTVSELVLIHSLIGQSKHVVLGRWPLRGQAANR
jgi:2'-5' RNA ligase